MKLEYFVTPINRYTFQSKKIKRFVEKWCNGKILNLFAGKTSLNVNEVRVDISDEFKPDYCMEALDFIIYWKTNFKVKFDTIILDPPYSYRKAMESYNGNYVSSFRKLKNELNEIINDGGLVISFGYDSTGMSRIRGYRKLAIALFNHKGAHHDTIAIVEQKNQDDLKNYIDKNDA